MPILTPGPRPEWNVGARADNAAMELNGLTALVTGGAAGIGAGIAERLAAEGMHVVIADLDDRQGPITAERIGGSFLRSDLADRADVHAAVDAAGPVGVLVNNAGGTEEPHFPAADPARWQRALDLNLHAVMLTTQLVLGPMRERGGGAIINIASTAGLGTASHDSPEYAVAKAGVVRFTACLAPLRDTIAVRVNCICPGLVDTPASRRSRARMTPAELAALPPVLSPADIAAVAMEFLADDTLAGRVMLCRQAGQPPRLLPVTDGQELPQARPRLGRADRGADRALRRRAGGAARPCRDMRIVRLANFVAPHSGGLRTSLAELGAGYLAAGHEPVLVIPGERDGNELTAQGRVITLRAPGVPFTGGYRVLWRRRRLARLLARLRPDALEVSDRTTLLWTGTWAREHGGTAVHGFLAAHGASGGFGPPRGGSGGNGSPRERRSHHGAGTEERGMTRFAALGDSITAGMGDPAPGGGWRGWAALLAGTLPQPDLHNLATLGALAADVERVQLAAATALRPDVASVVVGINDTLRGDFDPERTGASVGRTVAALRAAGPRFSPCGCPTRVRCSGCPARWPGRWPAGCAR